MKMLSDCARGSANNQRLVSTTSRGNLLSDSCHRTIFRFKDALRLFVGVEGFKLMAATENETSAACAANNRETGHAAPPECRDVS